MITKTTTCATTAAPEWNRVGVIWLRLHTQTHNGCSTDKKLERRICVSILCYRGSVMVGERRLMRSHGLTCSWAAGPVLFRRALFGSCKRKMCCVKKKKKRHNIYVGKFYRHQKPFTPILYSMTRPRPCKARTPPGFAGHKIQELIS